MAASLLTSILFCSASLFAQKPSFVTFEAPDAGVGNLQGTVPTSISNSGIIAGYYLDTNTLSHGFFRLTNGTIVEFNVPGLSGVHVSSVNSRGQIVGNGSRVQTVSVYHGWLRNPNGHFILIDPPGSAFTSVSGINDNGQIAGTYQDAAGVLHGFFRDFNGTYTTIDDPDAAQSIQEGTQVFAISPTGATIGKYDDENTAGIRGFVRDQFGNYTNFDAVAGGDSIDIFPIAINLGGEITGDYFDTAFVSHSFVRDASGVITLFDMPNSTGTNPTGMNDSNIIVGEWTDSQFNEKGFQRDGSGNLTSLSVPIANQGTFANAINNSRRITGYYWDTANAAHGFVK